MRYKQGDLVVNKIKDKGVMRVILVNEDEVFLAKMGKGTSMSWGVPESRIRLATSEEVRKHYDSK